MLRKINKSALILLLCLCVTDGFCSGLANRIDQIITKNSQQRVVYSISVLNAKTGKSIYQHNAKMPLIPASNMKIITTAAALHYLGPEFQYSTKVGLLYSQYT